MGTELSLKGIIFIFVILFFVYLAVCLLASGQV